MNKSPKTQNLSPQTPPVSHFDDKISKGLTAVTGWIRSFRTAIVGVILAALAALGFYGVYTLVQTSHEEKLNERLYRLIVAPEARDTEVALVMGDLDRLVHDARGARSERFILKSAVQYLAGKTFTGAASSSEDDALLEEHLGPGSQPSQAQTGEMEKKLEEYAHLGQDRFPQDEDMQVWSTRLLERLKTEREFRTKTLEKRSFAPLVPGTPATVPTAPSAAQSSPVQAPPQPGSPASSAPPATAK